MAEFCGGKRRIVWRKASQLVPYERNSRTHSEAQIAQIAASIREFGWTNPILIDERGGVIAGHGRLLAAQSMHKPGADDKVPCIVLDGLTEQQKRALVIADNKLALNAGWDDALLASELSGLLADGYDLGITGFGDDELAELLGDERDGLTDPDDVPEAPKEPVTRRGDVWQCGGHRVMCGDSTDVAAVENLVAGLLADMVFTDPPYGIDYSGGRTQVVNTKDYGKLKNDDLDGDDLGNLICNTFLFNKPEADVYICVSPVKQKPFLDWLADAEKSVDAVIVWNKERPGLGYMAYRRQTEFILFVKGRPFRKGDKSDFDLWSIGRDRGVEYVHGTQKPVALPIRAIQNSSKAGDVVLDLFGGSGSTLIACQQTGRLARVMELDPKFVDVIVMRWQEFTGEAATLEGDGRTFAEIAEARVPAKEAA